MAAEWRHLLRAQAFYERHGGKTIVLARFIPILRTFAPFVAGVGTMRYRRFCVFNIAGGVAWVTLFVMGGFLFGNLPLVKRHFHFVTLGIVILSVLPLVIEWVLSRRRQADADAGIGASHELTRRSSKRQPVSQSCWKQLPARMMPQHATRIC